MANEIDWQALAAPFAPASVSFRLQGNPRDGKDQAIVVAYLDARDVQQRLDDVCGPDGWAFDWQPVVTNNNAVLVAKGTLTIAGIAKSDVGDAGQTEPSKASVSDALKRAAVQWGIGRELYDLPVMWARVEKRGNSYVLARGEEDALRAKYLRAKPTAQTAPASTPRDNLAAQTKHTTPTPHDAPAASQTQAQPIGDSMSLTYASAIDQKRLSGQLAARWAAVDAQSGFLRNVTGRAMDAEKLRDGRSDISLDELLRANERLTQHRPAPAQANGKAAAK